MPEDDRPADRRMCLEDTKPRSASTLVVHLPNVQRREMPEPTGKSP